MPEEKGTLNGEINDLQDGLKVKERKVNDLQKRMENLQEQLRDKEKQMGSLTERVNSLQVHTSNTDTALTTLEESLAEKVRVWGGKCIDEDVWLFASAIHSIVLWPSTQRSGV